jgi:hypothetical protein
MGFCLFVCGREGEEVVYQKMNWFFLFTYLACDCCCLSIGWLILLPRMNTVALGLMQPGGEYVLAEMAQALSCWTH